MWKKGWNFIFCIVCFHFFNYNRDTGVDTVKGLAVSLKNRKSEFEEETDMKPYREMSKEELVNELQELVNKLDEDEEK